MATILVTGGAGYIGTHILVALAARGHSCISVDNYSNSSPRAIERVLRIVEEEGDGEGAIEALALDIRDYEALAQLLREREIDAVIHMAGLKSVGESVRDPRRYHDNNVRGTECLLAALEDSDVRQLVFSSSATVYGTPTRVPIPESAPLAPESPYGENKLAIERMLGRLARDDRSWRMAVLRYFNPVGAHPSGLIGEDPRGVPNNLMPYLCQAATGRREALQIFGNDYPTRDGTGVRDYVHVMDLAEGHLAALEALECAEGGAYLTLNLGAGRGVSVLELVRAFERVNGVAVPWRFAARRPGDIAECHADPALAERLLGWKARRGVEAMCRDAWRWQLGNPDGYAVIPERISVQFGTVPIPTLSEEAPERPAPWQVRR